MQIKIHESFLFFFIYEKQLRIIHLSRSGLNLTSKTLGGLLGNNLLLLGVLGSISLLLGLGLLLLLLGVQDSLGSGSLSDFGSLRSSLLDDIKRSTDDGSLRLDGLSSLLLVDFLSDTLLVLSSVQDGPRDSSRVLSLLEQSLRLGGAESENLGVTSDEKSATARVDFATRKGIDFNLHF